ncbi:MAG: arsenate reductase ArsC [Pseudomonadota bacterium]
MAPGGDPPSSVLFVCSQNAVRSPIAEGLMRRLFPRIYAMSAGVHEGTLDGFAVAAVEEFGGDIAHHRPQSLDELYDTSFDVIVTLTPEAHHKVLDMTHGMAVEVEYWPTEDPTVVDGNRDARLNAYRRVRDRLMHRIKQRFGWTPGVNE